MNHGGIKGVNKMLEKIKEYTKICLHPEHNPPTNIVLKAGDYKHICPGCGNVIIFTIPLISF